MISFHRLSLIACALTMPLLASCNVPEPIAGWFTVKPANSAQFEVLALEQVKQDSVRTMLGFNEWPFELKASPADKYVTCIVEFQQKDKPSRKLAHFTTFTDVTPHQKVNLGMMAVGTTVGGNNGWKIMLGNGKSHSSMVIGNPLLRKMSAIPGGVPEKLGENTFVLMTARDPEDATSSPVAAEATYKVVIKFIPSQKEWKPGQPLEYQSPMNASWLDNP